MSQVTDESTTHPVLSDVEKDHLALRQALERVQATSNPERLLDALDQLRAMLVRHFELEEEPEGFFDVIISMAPSKLATAQNDLAEHQQLLQRLDRLSAQVRECVEGPVAALRGGVAELVHHLHDHEVRETELFNDAVFTDLGRSS